MDRSPRFVLEFDVLSGDLIIDKCQHIHPEPYKSCHEELTLFIFGSPIINSIVDKKHIAQSIVNKRKLDENYLKSLDGEFLFILVNK